MKKENASLQGSTQRNDSWLFAATDCIVLRILIGTYSDSDLSLKSPIDNAYTASLLAVAGPVRMLVVTTRRDAINPPVPDMITLGVCVSMGLCNGQNSMILPVLLAVVTSGVLVGFLSSMIVVHLEIPAIIATMIMGYLIVTVTMLIGHNFNVFTMPSILKDIMAFRIVEMPAMVLPAVSLALAIHFLLISTVYGKGLLAAGQGLGMAHLMGVDVGKIQILAYVFAAVLAGLCGILIPARVTGVYLGMDSSYQMDGITCIVMGGILMSDGRADAAGTLVGSLFLYPIISYVQSMETNAGMQSMVKGTLIIAVLLIGAAENSDKNLRKKCEGSTACEIKTS